ncbi:glycoside hydrolase family 10 protein [Pannus brasiliensis CCIBt3594]|uniref:Glycoside hydrolase family 10 protein n=1 Tax=Pannus brasiliensis CCIBt3594 TaxID=1427578 RepID=A0AAW9QRS2_9CHRO
MTFSLLSRVWRQIGKKIPLLWFLASLIAVLLSPGLSIAFSQPADPDIRGVWITTNDTEILLERDKRDRAIEDLSKLNFNAVYPVVWNSGYALYPSEVAKREGIQPFVPTGSKGEDALKELIDRSREKGLRAIPWFEFGFMAPPTSEMAMKHPGWLTRKRDGTTTWVGAAGEVVWLNPFRPEVQNFISELVLEVARQYDIDGIQFDDHLSLPNEFGYDDFTVALYQQETQKTPPANPRDPEWTRWRADKITAFVANLNQALKAIKPNARFSIAPNPYEFAYNGHLQDWLGWVRQGLVDELIVQVYRPDMAGFLKQLDRPEIQETQQRIPTGIGVLSGLRTRPIELPFIQEKVTAARSRGLGIIFFFYESLWNRAPESIGERQAAIGAMFSQPIAPRVPMVENTPIATDPGARPAEKPIQNYLAPDGIEIPVIPPPAGPTR